MRDLKGQKNKRLKKNRKVDAKEPFDWKGFFHSTLRIAVATFSIVLIVVGGALSARVILDSGYFDVTQVRVEYANRVEAEEIVDLSDIQHGTSIFSLALGMIGRKIEENPWLAKADVLRVYPNEILIRVKEREPLAIINLDYLYYVDAGGEVFKVLSGGDELDYPVITGVTRDEVVDASGLPKCLRSALDLLLALKHRTVFSAADVSEIHCDPNEGVTLYTVERGVPIHFGREALRVKLDNLEQIYAELKERLHGLKYIDLNVEDRVIVRRVAREGMLQG